MLIQTPFVQFAAEEYFSINLKSGEGCILMNLGHLGQSTRVLIQVFYLPLTR